VILKIICVRREFNIWKDGRSSPIVDWLRALARQVHAECGGKGVGAVGMCFTGGFALAMMTEPVVVAPVLSQPSLPLRIKGGLDCSPAEIACAQERFHGRGPVADGLRFTSDTLVPDARIARLKPSSATRSRWSSWPTPTPPPALPMAPHSVLTLHLHRSVPGQRRAHAGARQGDRVLQGQRTGA
jgi:dienelactone hydrolase